MLRCPSPRSLVWSSVVLAGLSSLCLPASASEYPSGPITLVVGYGAGGGTDVCSRVLAQSVGKQLGQTVIVDNKPGAGTTLSLSLGMRHKPDGYGLTALSSAGVLNQVLMPKVAYDVTRDFTPVAMVAQYQAGILVRADSPHRTLADLIKASQAAGKPLSYSTAGIGTPQHLTSERLAKQVKVEWMHAPYKSGPEAITALLRGDVDFMAQTAEWVPHVREGRLRLLAVFTEDRIKGFDAPSLKELGYDLVAPSTLGVLGPAKMPAPVVQKLQKAFQVASQTPEFSNCADMFGLKLDYKDAATYAAYIQEMLTNWRPVLQQFASKD